MTCREAYNVIERRAQRAAFQWVVGVLVLASMGCASSQTTPSAGPTVDVTGKWNGRWSTVNGQQQGAFSLRLQQTGANVVGEVEIPGQPTQSGPLEGTVTGNEFSYRAVKSRGGAELKVSGDEMTGYSATQPLQFELRREQ